MRYCSVFGLLSIHVVCSSLGIRFCSARSTLLIGRNRFFDELDDELQVFESVCLFVCLFVVVVVVVVRSPNQSVSGNNQKKV